MADNILKIANDITLITDGVTSIPFPGILPIPTDKGMQLEVYINVAYGKIIPEIAWNVQENIKKTCDANNIKVSKINIHIEGLDFK